MKIEMQLIRKVAVCVGWLLKGIYLKRIIVGYTLHFPFYAKLCLRGVFL